VKIIDFGIFLLFFLFDEVIITDKGHAGIFNEGWDMFGTALVGGLLHVSPEKV
jgi:hypothetical protein